ncbi:DNA mismatch repair protein Mlh1 [Massospora cicadina]|nr:DNA mismatch repair protein Mlh1 [Massospora cicadina]
MESGTPQNGQGSLPRSNRIQKLSEAVSNKIAAGEVIQRPGNALKELLENSLDAGATNIQVQAKEGGLKFLQIQDNGTGIQLEDLPLVCHHHLWVRGEALASISHIARVSILTRTKDSKCAYRALYSSGALVPAKQGGPANPQPCAGNVGTTISVEDMFYNAPLRRKAFKLINEEYQRILDVMNRYAIHCSGVAFSCRKQGANFPDLQTTSHASTVEKISQIYGRKLALELLESKASSQEFKFQCKGYITHSNYNLRRIVFLLFINNRLVSSPALKRAIDGVYAPLLLKGTHPFIYLSLELPSNLVDVNVHPTKREVHSLSMSPLGEVNLFSNLPSPGALLFGERYNALSSGCAASSLAAPEAKGTPPARREASFPGATKALRPLSPSRESLSGFSFLGGKVTCADKVAVTPSPAKRQDNKYVRTDGQLQTLDAFYTPIKSPDLSRLSARLTPTPEKPVSLLEREALLLGIGKAAVDEPSVVEKPLASFGPVKPHRKRVEVRLTSVLDLIREFKEDSGMSSFVGCLDTKRAAIQYETKLYMVNYAAIRYLAPISN